MRSIVRRALSPLGAAVCLVTLASSAHADPALHVAPNAARRHLAAARNANANANAERRARVALTHRSSFAAARASSLVATSTDRFGDGEAIVHFEQTHRGLPVIGRGAAVRLSAAGEEILTALDLEEDLPSTTPSLGPSAAAAIAMQRATGSATADDAHLVVWPVAGGGARLAYVVLPRIPAGLPTSPRIVVDAQTGKVLESRDLVRFARASMYRSNPTKTPVPALFDLALTPAAPGTKLTSEFLTSTNCIDRKSVKPLDVQGFKANVHVCDLEQLATADESGDFIFTPSDTPGASTSRSDEFSEVSIYFHAAKAYDFFRTLQGVADAQVVTDKPLRVVANLQVPAGISSGNFLAAANPETPLDTFSNAFYSPAGGGLGAIFQQLYGLKGGGLWFGQGPVRDYAYDGDVVYHELTHAVVDATLKLEAWHVDAYGAIDAPGAMNEGLADYFSSAITGDPDVGEYASKESGQSTGVIRTLANQDACPSAILGEVHFDSTLFSGALWQARSALPEADRPKMDAAIYKAMRTNPGRGDLGYDDLAKLFLATLTTDLPNGAAAVDAAMKARGILPSCTRVLEPKNGVVSAIVDILGGFASPGTQTIPGGDVAPGIMQVHAKASATDTQLVVSMKTRASSGGGGNPLGGGGTPFTPVVLVKYGKAITWTASRGILTHDADQAVPMSAGTSPSATIEIPAGTTDVFVQITNKGESDGAYDDVRAELKPTAVETPPEEAAPVAAPVTTTTTESGCAVAAATGADRTTSSTSGAFAALLAGLAITSGVVRRRRR